MSEQTKSDSFEHELDEFFKERALFRTQTVSDSSKNKVSKERCDDEIKHRDKDDGSRSGCCMTGCHDCPWDYAG
jgi:cytidylate kinase